PQADGDLASLCIGYPRRQGAPLRALSLRRSVGGNLPRAARLLCSGGSWKGVSEQQFPGAARLGAPDTDLTFKFLLPSNREEGNGSDISNNGQCPLHGRRRGRRGCVVHQTPWLRAPLQRRAGFRRCHAGFAAAPAEWAQKFGRATDARWRAARSRWLEPHPPYRGGYFDRGRAAARLRCQIPQRHCDRARRIADSSHGPIRKSCRALSAGPPLIALMQTDLRRDGLEQSLRKRCGARIGIDRAVAKSPGDTGALWFLECGSD